LTDGRVVFVGCGPGAADLLTLRAVRAIAGADVVVWGRPLLPEAVVREHARPGAEVVAWPPATMQDVLAVYARARDEGLVVARLKSGDPGHLGEMAEELAAVRELGLPHEVVPGVTAAAAAGAAVGIELATPGRPLLHLAAADAAARPEPALAVYGAGHDPAAVVAGLRARGVAGDAACLVAIGIGWPDEAVVGARLDEVEEVVADLGRGSLAIVVVR
jgi:precorrin-4/cobalt-precorrin-4 C11-methyltransferase